MYVQCTYPYICKKQTIGKISNSFYYFVISYYIFLIRVFFLKFRTWWREQANCTRMESDVSTVATSDWFRERELVSARRESEFPNTKKVLENPDDCSAKSSLETRNISWNIKQNRFEIWETSKSIKSIQDNRKTWPLIFTNNIVQASVLGYHGLDTHSLSCFLELNSASLAISYLI